jgi:hypothetical protein
MTVISIAKALNYNSIFISIPCRSGESGPGSRRKQTSFFACFPALIPVKLTLAREVTPFVDGDLGNQEGALQDLTVIEGLARMGTIMMASSKRSMKIHPKTIVALAVGAMLLSGLLGQTAQAVLLNESGTSILADSLGTATGPEALTVSWSVVENVSLVYTYSYSVNNPVGDVNLNNGSPEPVDSFSVAFDTTAPGAFITGSQTGGGFDLNNGASGLFWAFAPVNPGTSSGPLSFESDQPPTLGNANAQDANPPSPWSSNPDGQQVPVPIAVPEPGTWVLVAIGTGLGVFLRGRKQARR